VDPQDLIGTGLRASLVYLCLLVVIRVLGKRSVGAIGAFDLVVALMLGEVVDEIVFGDVSITKGFVAIGVIAAWQFADEWACFRSKVVRRLSEGNPSVLVQEGRIQSSTLAAERMSEDELWSQLRMQGVDDLADVERATLETSGEVSVLLRDEARPIEKRDLWQTASGGGCRRA
jgi:uncharacterized membrane protein YcaP (DUF421 family)